MRVLSSGKLNPDFLKASATTNARATLKALQPKKVKRGRSRQDLLDSIAEDDLSATVEDFVRSMWLLLDSQLTGTYHVMVLSINEWLQKGSVQTVETVMRNIQSEILATDEIVTEQALAARITPNSAVGALPRIDILYLGEAEAEQHEEEKDYKEILVEGEYLFKAYRMVQVPVLSVITIDAEEPYITIITRPIHQGVTPRNELDELQPWLEEQFLCPFPPVIGIRGGVRELMRRERLQPRSISVEEADGARVDYRRAPGTQNSSSQSVEQTIKGWDTHRGSLSLDSKYPFKVDTGRAIFSFNSRTSLEQAHHVIQTVLGAAP